MRIPDDVEELVLAFMELEKKADLRKMTREQIEALILGEIGCAVEPGYLEKNDETGAFPFKVTIGARILRYWRRAREVAGDGRGGSRDTPKGGIAACPFWPGCRILPIDL
jgi:hypothetical protein